MIPIFPRKCLGCGRRMDRGLFCASCAEAYESARSVECVDCERSFRECRCIPQQIAENRSICGFAKLYNYDPSDPYATTSHMIYLLKRGKSKKIIDLYADAIAESLAASGICGEKWQVTYVPRSRRAIAKYGYDQMKKLAYAVSQRLGSSFVTAIVRRGNREQKRLGALGRAYAASNAYCIRAGLDLKGKRMILLDDILTTGATLSNCAKVLRRAGASKIFCTVIAESRRERLPENK